MRRVWHLQQFKTSPTAGFTQNTYKLCENTLTLYWSVSHVQWVISNLKCVCACRYHVASPVQAWFVLQDVGVNQLFKQTVHQDGQRGKADVVQRQINTVIQSLGQRQRFTQQQFTGCSGRVNKPKENRRHTCVDVYTFIYVIQGNVSSVMSIATLVSNIQTKVMNLNELPASEVNFDVPTLKLEEQSELTCCENRQKNWYKNWGVIKHTFCKERKGRKHILNVTVTRRRQSRGGSSVL